MILKISGRSRLAEQPKHVMVVVEKEKPDVIILACGSVPIIPDIDGIKEDNIATSREAMEEKKAIGHRVIIIGSVQVGCETANMLAGKGRKVINYRNVTSAGFRYGRS